MIEPFGLNNIGNTCFFNSLVQGLFSCKPLVDYLKKNNVKDNKLYSILQDIANGVNVHTQAGILSIELSQKVRAKKSLKFGGGAQEDSDEAFKFLFELTGSVKLEQLFAQQYKYFTVCDTCHRQLESDKKPIFLNTNRFIIPHRQNEVNKSFIELMRHRINPVTDLNCKTCKTRRTFTRHELLDKINSIFTVTMYKYSGKINVKFPSTLSFNNNTLIYELQAIIDHHGSQGGGHYTCRARRGNKIYTLNDSGVSPGNLDPTPSAYILFYVKK